MGSITAIMIVRNEVEMIPITLPPLIEALDEVIVVDMMSDDGTRELCQSLLRPRDLLVDYDQRNLFNFGFGHPRNYGAKFSRADWILAVDADEYVSADDLRRLSTWVATNSPNEVNIVNRRNYAPSGDFSLSDLPALMANAECWEEEHGRFYRNGPTVRWEGLIHEEVWGPERLGGTERGHVPLTLHHLANYKAAYRSGHDHVSKTLLYSYLMAKAYRFPGFRFGTNAFWFDDYIPKNYDSIKDHADEFARKNLLYPAIT